MNIGIKMSADNDAKLNNLFSYMVAVVIAYSVYYILCPGFISYDTLEQYKQAAGIIPVYTAHPVIMSYFWMLLIKLTDRPELLFLLFQFLYWSSVALLANVLTKKISKRLIIIFFVGFWPPLFLISLNVWKDVVMMCALSISGISIYAYSRTPKRFWIILCLISLLIATAVRVNGFIPSVFISMGLFLIFFIENKNNFLKSIIKSMICAMLFLITSILFVFAINSSAVKTPSLGSLVGWDFACISIDENKIVIPDYMIKGKNKETLLQEMKLANSREANFPVFSVISTYIDAEDQGKLKYDWIRIIIENPEAYFKHRWYVFSVLSGKSVNGHTYYPFHPGIQSNDQGFYFKHINEDTANTLIGFFTLVADTIPFKVYIYYIISILIIVRCVYNAVTAKGNAYTNIAISTICISGLMSNLSLFFLATAADFRYSIWQILSVVIATLMMVSSSRYQKK
ncbi:MULTISPECIES: hypothetical protein [Citrobacter]|uniref:hypothetical protein n=1 Tax=Citrobacter sp. TBCS-14 TaxID=2576409 RepID=UPI00113ECC37|nr:MULTISPECIES: hypothetical protein [Citrobacter]QLY59981.1 hypothetical protein HV211_05565 [Citrobacter freundii]QLZ58866.1 hypothetical protein HV079_06785 [Citrobacter freundii]TKV17609.1 hypothetical protein FDX22_13610 [Citrobacter sp. TBCS-14]